MIRHVVIANVWHQDNRGDLALAETLIDAVRKRWPHCDISVLSMISSTSAHWPTAHSLLESKYQKLRVLANPLPLDIDDLRGVEGLRRVARLAYRFFGWLTGLDRLFGASIGPVKDVDLIVSVGGHYLFTASRGPRSAIRLFRLCWPLIALARRGVPMVLFSQSIGPIHGSVSRHLARQVLSLARLALFRESTSLETAAALAPLSKRALMPDSAFALQPLSRHDSEEGFADEHFAVLTLREPMGGEPAELTATREAYLAAMMSAARLLLNRPDIRRLVVVPHVTGPTILEDDRRISREFVTRLNRPEVQLHELPAGVEPALALYGRARVIIGTRLHSVIFALSQGVPAVAISYFGPKSLGIMHSLGVADLCLDMKGVTDVEIGDAVARCLEPTRHARLREQVAAARARVESSLEFIA